MGNQPDLLINFFYIKLFHISCPSNQRRLYIYCEKAKLVVLFLWLSVFVLSHLGLKCYRSLWCCFFRSFFPLSAPPERQRTGKAIFCAEPPAQKDFLCTRAKRTSEAIGAREVSHNVPVLQLVWDYMKLCFRNCPKSFHIQNQLPCVIIILANKFLIYTSCCKSQLMTFAV